MRVEARTPILAVTERQSSALKVGVPRRLAVRREVKQLGLPWPRLKHVTRLLVLENLTRIGGRRRAYVKRSKVK
jgi:hypothetical protein